MGELEIWPSQLGLEAGRRYGGGARCHLGTTWPQVSTVFGKRGIVTVAGIYPSLFDEVQSLREFCKEIIHLKLPMSILQPTLSQPYCYNFSIIDRVDPSDWYCYERNKISPRDLFASIWQPDNSPAPKPHGDTHIGFAMARTRPCDILCQFPQTVICIILREVEDRELTVVGRAHLAYLATSGSGFVTEKYELPRNLKEKQKLLVKSKAWETLFLLELASGWRRGPSPVVRRVPQRVDAFLTFQSLQA